MDERLLVKDEDDLARKLEEAIEDKESIPLSEVVRRMNRIIIKDQNDLEEKLEEGIKDIEAGNVYSFDEVYNESKAILNNGNSKKDNH